MSHITIRPVTHADQEALFDLRLRALKTNPEAFGSDYEDTIQQETAGSYARRIPDTDSHNLIVCAEQHGKLVGMAGFVRETRAKTKHSGFIWGVFVDPAVRGQGTGRRMMDALINHIHGLDGLNAVILSVVTENKAAIHLYEACGFKVWGTQPDALRVDGRAYDMHWMSYRITSSAPHAGDVAALPKD